MGLASAESHQGQRGLSSAADISDFAFRIESQDSHAVVDSPPSATSFPQ